MYFWGEREPRLRILRCSSSNWKHLVGSNDVLRLLRLLLGGTAEEMDGSFEAAPSYPIRQDLCRWRQMAKEIFFSPRLATIHKTQEFDPLPHTTSTSTMVLLAQAARQLAQQRQTTLLAARRTMASLTQFEDYGKAVFTGKVADEYLTKHGASGAILKDPTWVSTHADVVANAVFDW